MASKQDELNAAMAAISLPTELPPPHAPRCRKRDLYTDPSVFAELDEDVIRVSVVIINGKQNKKIINDDNNNN